MQIHTIDVVFFIVFYLIWNAYKTHSAIGLYLSIFTIFFSNLLIYTSGYGELFMIKSVFISFTALCIFGGILYDCLETSVNNILTWLIRLNIFILIFSIDINWLKVLLFISAMTVPYIKIKDGKLDLESSLVDKNLWILLSTGVLAIYYNQNIYFKNNNSYLMTLMSLFIPCILHFYSNAYFESRAILLCLALCFDVFNHNKSIFNIKW